MVVPAAPPSRFAFVLSDGRRWGRGGGIYVLLALYLFHSGFRNCRGQLLGVLAIVCNERARRKRPGKSRRQGVRNRSSVKPVVIVSAAGILIFSFLIILVMRAISTDTLLATRNFYGVLRVWEINTDQPELRADQLTHGKTVHGFQFRPTICAACRRRSMQKPVELDCLS
jgi:hypothetical protein